MSLDSAELQPRGDIQQKRREPFVGIHGGKSIG
jgi:hypothetical protein